MSAIQNRSSALFYRFKNDRLISVQSNRISRRRKGNREGGRAHKIFSLLLFGRLKKETQKKARKTYFLKAFSERIFLKSSNRSRKDIEKTDQKKF